MMAKSSLKMIDISAWQTNIDWNKAKADGVTGVIIRAGYRTAEDARFKTHILGASKAGLHIGIYWFSYAYTEAMAKDEAAVCLKVIAPYKKYIDMPVFFDWEYDSMKYAKKHGVVPGRQLITGMTKVFCEKIKAAGYMAGVYYNYDYKVHYYDLAKLKGFYKWYALYTTVKQANCDIQQYTSTGRIAGYSGNIDMNYCFTEFWNIGKKPADDSKNDDKSKDDSKNENSETDRKVSDTKMPTIKSGSKGKAVKIWQIICGADPDGIFGPKTKEKTEAFQKKHKLTVDGIVGPKTWKAGLESV